MFTQAQMQVYFQFLAQAFAAEHELTIQLNKEKGVYAPHAERQTQIANDLYDLIDAQFAKLEAKAKAEVRDAKIHNDLVNGGKLVDFPAGRPTA